ncbi:MAG: four helix bundle protein [Clostridia bacterium]|nr:four helix bundle protein [Clostridia bacterium]
MANYEELIVWQKAMTLTEEIYRIVKFLPKEELFGLSDQMRRAAVSIPSNIAEGHGRDTNGDFRRFLLIARGFLMELETQLEVCRRLHYIPEKELEASCSLCSEIEKILWTMINKPSSRIKQL